MTEEQENNEELEIDEYQTEEDVKEILKIKPGEAPVKEEKIEEPIKKEEPKIERKEEKPKDEVKEKPVAEKKEHLNPIFALRTTANREEQVLDFITSNVEKKGINVYSIINPHGMRGYIFLEAKDRQSAEESFQGVPYARGLLPNFVRYEEIEHMLEQVKKEVNIQKHDIVEIISGPFKREQAKVSRIDQQKEEVIVELLESAIPIPITVKLDAVKVIRRESDESKEEDEKEE
jgi:transcriptional antiterminator NusG